MTPEYKNKVINLEPRVINGMVETMFELFENFWDYSQNNISKDRKFWELSRKDYIEKWSYYCNDVSVYELEYKKFPQLTTLTIDLKDFSSDSLKRTTFKIIQEKESSSISLAVSDDEKDTEIYTNDLYTLSEGTVILKNFGIFSKEEEAKPTK